LIDASHIVLFNNTVMCMMHQIIKKKKVLKLNSEKTIFYIIKISIARIL